MKNSVRLWIEQQKENCGLCPRQCRISRHRQTGYCRAPEGIYAARAALHQWEEPCISGFQGSGAVFFCGCTLRCCFCQNHLISRTTSGASLSVSQLADVFLRLQDQGAHNINLVTPTHFLPWILPALDQVKGNGRLAIPIVYNCGGYEQRETVQMLKDYVDVWLPDLKYESRELSQRFSAAPDYFEAASGAIQQMIAQTGPPVLRSVPDSQGKLHSIMERGVIIRHLVLPSHRDDSIRLLRWIARELPPRQFFISLMSQYTPYQANPLFPELNRRLTTYEYQKVVDEALALGLDQGFMQKRSSAKEEYTPSFCLEGLQSNC